MSVITPIERVDRTLAVQNTSYRLAYVFLSFAVLLDVAFRSFTRHDPAWDLLAIVILAGLLATLYQAIHKVLSVGWIKLVVVTLCVSGIVAALISLLR
jgi:hypothetical protein